MTSPAVPDPPLGAADDTAEFPSPAPVPARRASVLVIETVVFQHPSDQPTDCRSSYQYRTESDEQPYSRTYSVGEEWVPLDVGWLKDVGVGELCVRNVEGADRATYPTPAEVAETAAKVVEIGEGCESYPGVFLLVRPGRSCRFEPETVSLVLVRSRSGRTRIRVTAFPR